MIFNDLKKYQQLTASLEKVSREIRQNVPHLKFQDDIFARIKKAMNEQEKHFWELDMSLGKANRQFQGLLSMMEKSVPISKGRTVYFIKDGCVTPHGDFDCDSMVSVTQMPRKEFDKIYFNE